MLSLPLYLVRRKISAISLLQDIARWKKENKKKRNVESLLCKIRIEKRKKKSRCEIDSNLRFVSNERGQFDHVQRWIECQRMRLRKSRIDKKSANVNRNYEGSRSETGSS